MNFTYTWDEAFAFVNGTSSDGSAIAGAFAGHTDWRLPALDELQGIVDLNVVGCGSGSPSCIDPIFGPTVASFYWSATTSSVPSNAWLVGFVNGFASSGGKGFNYYVRAVRAGL